MFYIYGNILSAFLFIIRYKIRKKEYYFAEHFWSELLGGKIESNFLTIPLKRIILSLVWKIDFDYNILKRSWP